MTNVSRKHQDCEADGDYREKLRKGRNCHYLILVNRDYSLSNYQQRAAVALPAQAFSSPPVLANNGNLGPPGAGRQRQLVCAGTDLSVLQMVG